MHLTHQQLFFRSLRKSILIRTWLEGLSLATTAVILPLRAPILFARQSLSTVLMVRAGLLCSQVEIIHCFFRFLLLGALCAKFYSRWPGRRDGGLVFQTRIRVPAYPCWRPLRCPVQENSWLCRPQRVRQPRAYQLESGWFWWWNGPSWPGLGLFLSLDTFFLCN